MATYICLANFKDQANLGANWNPPENYGELMGEIGGMGIRMSNVHLTLGRYDLIFTIESPSNSAASLFATKAAKAWGIKYELLPSIQDS